MLEPEVQTDEVSHHYKETEMTQTTKITKPRSVNNIAVGCSPYQINVTVL